MGSRSPIPGKKRGPVCGFGNLDTFGARPRCLYVKHSLQKRKEKFNGFELADVDENSSAVLGQRRNEEGTALATRAARDIQNGLRNGCLGAGKRVSYCVSLGP